MSSDLSSALQQLEQAAVRLNQLTDEATSTVESLETILADLSIGIEVSVQFGKARILPKIKPPQKTGTLSEAALSLSRAIFNEFRTLEYRRAGKDKQYRIVVRDYDDSILSWSELARDIKIQAITALPMLIRELLSEIQQRVRFAESALEEVTHVLRDYGMEE